MDYPLSDSPGGGVATADFNGDRNQDLVVTFGRNIGVLLGNGDGTFRTRIDQAIELGTGLPSLPTVADVNRDGKPDLLVATFADSLSSTVTVMLGTGDGTFVTKGRYPASVFPDSMAVGDVTGDGKLDIVVYSSASVAVSVLPGAGTGAFLASRTSWYPAARCSSPRACQAAESHRLPPVRRARESSSVSTRDMASTAKMPR